MAEQPPLIAEQVQIPAKWIEDPSVPVYFANAFAAQPVQNEFILTFAVAAPPVFTKAITKEDAAKLVVTIKPTVRIGMTPDRVIELIQLLQTQLNAYSQATLKN